MSFFTEWLLGMLVVGTLAVLYYTAKALAVMAFVAAMAATRRERCKRICINLINNYEMELDLHKEGKSTKTEKEISVINGSCIAEKGYLLSIKDEEKFAQQMCELGQRKGLFKLLFRKTTVV